MAEGWARHLKGERVRAYSAGIKPRGLDPRAVEVMAEAGVDISRQRSKHVDELRDVRFDYVVTLCADADERCPTFPGGAKSIHVPFDDPPLMARRAKTDDEAMLCYRQVRDEIKAFIQSLPGTLSQ